MKRKLIYGFIYIAVAMNFPSLPLHGLSFIMGVIRGSTEATVGFLKDEGKHHLIDALNPFN